MPARSRHPGVAAGVDAQSHASRTTPERSGVAVARRASGAAGVGLGRAGGLERDVCGHPGGRRGRGRTPIAPEILFALWLYATLEGVGSARRVAGWRRSTTPTAGSAAACRSTTTPCRISAAPRRGARRIADRQRGGLDGGWGGHAQAGGAGRGAGTRQCRSRLVSARDSLEDVPGGGARASPTPQGAARGRPRRGDAAPAGGARACRPERKSGSKRPLERLPELAEIKSARQEARRGAGLHHRCRGHGHEDGRWWLSARPTTPSTPATPTARSSSASKWSPSARDMGQLAPMVEQVERALRAAPRGEWLVDGGYPAHEQLDAAAEHTVVYAPVPKPKDTADSIRTSPKTATARRWPPGASAWAPTRPRTSTRSGRPRPSASTPRRANVVCRALRVRGPAKVRCVALLYALAHNLMRMVILAPELVGIGTGTSAVCAMVV